MSVYYNEFDPKAAAWLRELIAAGLIPDGTVDERSIVDVQPNDLREFSQCHFFAGIGGWPYALRLAGWPEDREVWTGSCPCQPLSCAGKGLGHADERHLWPAFYRLISECNPPIVFGEQVASTAGREWFAGIRADLEGVGYAVGGADLCAASIGAPHIRQRLFWVAESSITRCSNAREGASYISHGAHSFSQRIGSWNGFAHDLRVGRLAGAELRRSEQRDGGQRSIPEPHQDGGLGDTNCERGSSPRVAGTSSKAILPTEGKAAGTGGGMAPWSSATWHYCRDGKYRRIPVEPALFPLAHGLPGRVGLLRGSGNAIVPQVAAEFIKAYLEATAMI